MADPSSFVAEASGSFDNSSTHANTTSPPNGFDTCSSHSTDQYQPLPEGRWVVPFHGNCPRCHHHHSAAQVKIKVTKDSSHISRVDCEKCNERWIAIGGRNATVISLLSVTSSETDSVVEGVRYSLIDVVREVTQRAASLPGTIPEQPSDVQTGQISTGSSALGLKRAPPRPLNLSPAVLSTESTPHPDFRQGQQHLASVSPSVAEFTIIRKNGSSPRQLLSRLKRKVTSRFPELHRHNLRNFIGLTRQSKKSARQFEKSPVRTPPATDHQIIDLAEQSSAVETQVEEVSVQYAGPTNPEVDAIRPCQRLAEVVEFIATLDKSILESKSEQERNIWMREIYTDFKRNRRLGAPTGIAAIVRTRGQRDLPGSFNRRSAEVLGAGIHIIGLEGIDSPERTISFSEVDSESQRVREDNSPASFLRHSRQQILERVRRGPGPQRPYSMPSPPRSTPLAHHSVRNSFHALIHSRPGSTSSLRGQASSRWSQNSLTLHGSTQDPQESLSGETQRHLDNDEDRNTNNLVSSPQHSASSDQGADTEQARYSTENEVEDTVTVTSSSPLPSPLPFPPS